MGIWPCWPRGLRRQRKAGLLAVVTIVLGFPFPFLCSQTRSAVQRTHSRSGSIHAHLIHTGAPYTHAYAHVPCARTCISHIFTHWCTIYSHNQLYNTYTRCTHSYHSSVTLCTAYALSNVAIRHTQPCAHTLLCTNASHTFSHTCRLHTRSQT